MYLHFYPVLVKKITKNIPNLYFYRTCLVNPVYFCNLKVFLKIFKKIIFFIVN